MAKKYKHLIVLLGWFLTSSLQNPNNPQKNTSNQKKHIHLGVQLKQPTKSPATLSKPHIFHLSTSDPWGPPYVWITKVAIFASKSRHDVIFVCLREKHRSGVFFGNEGRGIVLCNNEIYWT